MSSLVFIWQCFSLIYHSFSVFFSPSRCSANGGQCFQDSTTVIQLPGKIKSPLGNNLLRKISQRLSQGQWPGLLKQLDLIDIHFEILYISNSEQPVMILPSSMTSIEDKHTQKHTSTQQCSHNKWHSKYLPHGIGF